MSTNNKDYIDTKDGLLKIAESQTKYLERLKAMLQALDDNPEELEIDDDGNVILED